MHQQHHNIPEISVVYNPPITKPKVKVLSSFEAYEIFIDYFPADSLQLQERLLVMYLNSASQVLGIYVHTIGGMTSTIADIRLILSVGLKVAATSMMLCHNHPTGNLNPSQMDIQLTDKLKEASKWMDVKLIDHIILIASTDKQYYSFGDSGLL